MGIIKKIFKSKIFLNMIIIGLIFASFYVLDVLLRIFSNKYVDVYSWYHFSPNLFTFSWIFLFIGIFYLLPKKAGNITYLVLLILFNIITYAEILHFKILNRFFAFSDLFLAKEGSDYFLYAIGKTSLWMIGLLLLSIGLGVGAILLSNHVNGNDKNKKPLLKAIIIVPITVIVCLLFRTFGVYKLGSKVDELSWEAAYTPKNIYVDFNSQGRSLEVSGLYELVFRSTYKYIKNELSFDRKKIIKEIDNELADSKKVSEENEMTGIFKGKNVIFILMESIDSWLISDEVMPTLNELKNTGMNFTKRYSPPFGGGQTINSEFAVNTGLYSINNGKAIYNYDTNKYSYSLANLFKKNGYSAVSVHGNLSSFYNRENFHLALGYDTFLGLNSLDKYDKDSYNYLYDTNLIKNKKVYNEIVREEPFLTFITTYSAHIPYDSTNEKCNKNPYNLNVDGDEELSCVRNLAHETDEMIRLLIEGLKEDNKLDNTVLIFAADHYAYGYTNEENLIKYKGTTDSLLLQNVPFIIWSKDIGHKDIDILLDTADILPTIINMMGISYNPSFYVGEDVFNKERDNYIYFSEDTFFDGNRFFDENDDEELLNKMSKDTKKKMELNKNFIISDYFRDK